MSMQDQGGMDALVWAWTGAQKGGRELEYMHPLRVEGEPEIYKYYFLFETKYINIA